jgi:16S rRNA C1402 (ribose-2'-O) methylase RsmI
VSKALKTIASEFSSLDIVVGKELTKLHERFFSGKANQVCEEVCQEIEREGSVGEWCFCVCFSTPEAKKTTEKKKDQEVQLESDPSWIASVKCLVLAGVSSSESARILSQQFGISKNFCYQQIINYLNYKKI